MFLYVCPLNVIKHFYSKKRTCFLFKSSANHVFVMSVRSRRTLFVPQIQIAIPLVCSSNVYKSQWQRFLFATLNSNTSMCYSLFQFAGWGGSCCLWPSLLFHSCEVAFVSFFVQLISQKQEAIVPSLTLTLVRYKQLYVTEYSPSQCQIH